MAIRIDKVVVRQVRMPLVHFFETSFGRTYTRDIVLVEVLGNGLSGWGEVTAGENPFYNEEWTASVWPLLTGFAIPRVLGRDLDSAADVAPLIAHIRGHKMARGGLEAAVWDLQSRLNSRPLWSELNPSEPSRDQRERSLPSPSEPSRDQRERSLPSPSEPSRDQRERSLPSPSEPSRDQRERSLPSPSEPSRDQRERSLPSPSEPSRDQRERSLPSPSEPSRDQRERSLPSPSEPSRDQRERSLPSPIPCGVSIGVQDTLPQLLEKIRTELNAGYQRIKIKIKPGWDIDTVREVRREFPSILLMADANSAYTLADTDHLRRLDDFGLMMIEQPLAHDDIIDHAKLQAKLETPICLDECIRSAHHAEQAIAMGACRIVNIKLGRVGGFREAICVHDVCARAGIPVWCGGMLESGIGRAHNIALSTLPNFTLPGDVSASKRYWARDLITPPVEVTPRGTIEVREQPGFGYDIDHDFLRTVTVREEAIG